MSFSVSVLARQVHSPIAGHLALAKLILRFVAGTVGVFHFCPRSKPVTVRSFRALVDADWGGCKETRKSSSVCVISVNDSPVVCRSWKQTVASPSSREAEYVALFDCTKHVSWMQKFYWEMTNKCPWSTTEIKIASSCVFTDSSAAEVLASVGLR